MQYPKISIITPSYNQGQFLEETIQSVIGQMYPNLEYIVMDGGSTDNSVDIIKRYEKYITYWESKPDKGQAHAINKGFKKATGNILAWVNSDDYYLPGTLRFVASILDKVERTILFGNSVHIYEDTKKIYGSNVLSNFRRLDLKLADTIIQPSCFWNRSTLEEVGLLNEEMHYAFDWEWFIRSYVSNIIKFEPVDKYLSVYRKTRVNKSTVGGGVRNKEIASIYKMYSNSIVYEANEYVVENIDMIRRFNRWTQWIRPYRFKIILFKAFFFKIYRFDYKYIQVFVNNARQ